MESQRSKHLFGSKFWVLGGLLVTLESLKSVRAIMAPTQVITSFQSSGGIGLIGFNENVYQDMKKSPRNVFEFHISRYGISQLALP